MVDTASIGNSHWWHAEGDNWSDIRHPKSLICKKDEQEQQTGGRMSPSDRGGASWEFHPRHLHYFVPPDAMAGERKKERERETKACG